MTWTRLITVAILLGVCAGCLAAAAHGGITESGTGPALSQTGNGWNIQWEYVAGAGGGLSALIGAGMWLRAKTLDTYSDWKLYKTFTRIIHAILDKHP